MKSAKRVGDGLGDMDLGPSSLAMAMEDDIRWVSRGALVTNAISNW